MLRIYAALSSLLIVFVGALSVGGGCGQTNGGCPAGETSCGGACVRTSIDKTNCGACGMACDSTSICNAGSCVSVCGQGEQACGTMGSPVCTHLQSDNLHCGSCDTACQTLELCVS